MNNDIVRDQSDRCKPIGELTRDIILRLIAEVEEESEQEEMIRIALDEGAITYYDAYKARTGDDLP